MTTRTVTAARAAQKARQEERESEARFWRIRAEIYPNGAHRRLPTADEAIGEGEPDEDRQVGWCGTAPLDRLIK